MLCTATAFVLEEEDGRGASLAVDEWNSLVEDIEDCGRSRSSTKLLETAEFVVDATSAVGLVYSSVRAKMRRTVQ